MNKSQKTGSFYLFCALATQLCMSANTYAAISNVPPLVKPNVPPNIFYTLDDSGSMMWEILPDNIAKTGNGDVKGTTYSNYCANDGDCWITYLFPKPSNIYNVGGAGDYSSANQGVVGFANNITVARFRSSDVNKIYYNPAVVYQPWAATNGGTMDNANPKAALYNPVAPNGGSNLNVIDLTANVTYANGAYSWLKADASGIETTGRTIFPALYYTYNGGAGCNLSTLSCFTRIEIKPSTILPLKAPTRTDCIGATCTTDEEMQNFANWFQYYRSRILTARAGSGIAFSKQNTTIRVGFGTINTDGTVINHVSDDFSAANKTAFLTTLYTQRMPAAGTPLRNAVDDVGQYFSNTTNTGPWQTQYGVGSTSTQLTCRQNYNILMTDGAWNGAGAAGGRNGNYDGSSGVTITGPTVNGVPQTYTYAPVAPYADNYSDTLADIAFYYWSKDLRPDWSAAKKNVPTSSADPAFWQHLVHFTVGLGVVGSLNPAVDLPALTNGTKQWPQATASANQVDDLWHAAVNSRGKFFSASDPAQFSSALESSLNTISERVGDAAAVGTSSNTVRAGTSLYTSTYRTSDWSGQLVQRKLDTDGNITGNGWTASAPAYGSRKIFTYVDASSRGKTFDLNNLTASDQTYFTTEAATYTPAGSITAANLIDYIKGRNDLSLLRPRTQTFGDFVNSAPQYLKEGEDAGYTLMPVGTAGRSDYNNYLISKTSRAPMVYIGGNDGMLHAFDGATGVEAFAYVPKAVMSNLPLLSRKDYGHRFYVDGTPAVGDYYDGGWKTALVGTTGAGGRSVFALDVSNPLSFAASNVLWEVNSGNDADLGYTIGSAQIARMPNGDWVAVVGNGYESANKRAVLFIIRLKDGVVTKVDTGVGSAGSPNGLATPVVAMDSTAAITAIYAGDLLGNLWKFDVKTTGTTIAFGNKPLFVAKNGSLTQPITVQPDLIPHSRGGTMVLFGTGKIFESADALNNDVQSLYGVWDNTGVANVTATPITTSQDALQQQTLSWFGTSFYKTDNKTVDWATKRGWFMNLNLSTGERVTIEPQIFFDEVFFTTIIPASAVDTCSSDGKSTLFILAAESGMTFAQPLMDTNGDGKVDSTDTVVAGRQSGLTFGTTILKKGGTAIVYQPPSTQGLSATNRADVKTAPNPTTRTWRQLLKPN